MNQIIHVEPGEAHERSQMEKAKQICAILEKHYPNHYWIVGFQSDALIIRHLAIANAMTFATGKEGFGALLPKDRLGTPKELERTVVKFGGSLLEAFKLPRGAWDGRDPIVPPQFIKSALSGSKFDA